MESDLQWFLLVAYAARYFEGHEPRRYHRSRRRRFPSVPQFTEMDFPHGYHPFMWCSHPYQRFVSRSLSFPTPNRARSSRAVVVARAHPRSLPSCPSRLHPQVGNRPRRTQYAHHLRSRQVEDSLRPHGDELRDLFVSPFFRASLSIESS